MPKFQIFSSSIKEDISFARKHASMNFSDLCCFARNVLCCFARNVPLLLSQDHEVYVGVPDVLNFFKNIFVRLMTIATIL